MNVLMVVPWDTKFGGVVSVAGNLARYLRSSGHNVEFIHPGGTNVAKRGTTAWGFSGYKLRFRPPSESESPVHSLIAFLVHFPVTFLQLIYLAVKHRIKIINVHYPSSDCVYFALLRVLLPVKLVLSIHGADMFPEGRRRDRYSIADRLQWSVCDRIVAPSKTFLNEFLSEFPKLRGKSTHIHNAVDLSELDANGDASAARDDTSPIRILCIATHNGKKALDVLIRAFSFMRDRHPMPELVLVGDGPLRAKLEDLAKDLQVDSRVNFLGWQGREEVGRLLRECDLFVLPSRSEPFGIVVIEALACGKPVVASAVGGVTEIIENGVTGMLVPPEDPSALAAAIDAILDNPDLGRKLGIKGRTAVVDRFSVERNGMIYEQLFMSLIR